MYILIQSMPIMRAFCQSLSKQLLSEFKETAQLFCSCFTSGLNLAVFLCTQLAQTVKTRPATLQPRKKLPLKYSIIYIHVEIKFPSKWVIYSQIYLKFH